MLQHSSEIKGFHSAQVDPRYFVPDLSPQSRSALKGMNPRCVFVAESPHVSEVEPDQIDQRRPLCGMAGKKWWGLLSLLLEGEENTDVSSEHLVRFCKKHRIVVMNSVQYPLDPKVSRVFPNADPIKNLGFAKMSGQFGFKRMKKSESMQKQIQSLRERLNHSSLGRCPIYCLGNDAEWFVQQALGEEGARARLGAKIPHPSAWWRQGGLFGRIAKEKLTQVLLNSSDKL